MASVITTKTSTVFVAMAMLCTLAVSSIAGASERVLADMMTLYVGESKVIEAPGVIRMTVGQSDLISTTLLDNSEIVLIAEKSGETNIQIWFSDGHRESMPIVVVESNGWREQLEVQALLKNVKGVSVTTIGRRIVIDGTVEERELDRIKAIKDRYKDILDLSRVISDFEQKLPSTFLRTHRSYIVNSQKITAYTAQDIEIGAIEIPIGISYKKLVSDFLKS